MILECLLVETVSATDGLFSGFRLMASMYSSSSISFELLRPFPELSVWLLLMWSDEEKRDRELCLRRFLHKFVFSTKKEEKDEILLYHTCVQQAR